MITNKTKGLPFGALGVPSFIDRDVSGASLAGPITRYSYRFPSSTAFCCSSAKL